MLDVIGVWDFAEFLAGFDLLNKKGALCKAPASS